MSDYSGTSLSSLWKFLLNPSTSCFASHGGIVLMISQAAKWSPLPISKLAAMAGPCARWDTWRAPSLFLLCRIQPSIQWPQALPTRSHLFPSLKAVVVAEVWFFIILLPCAAVSLGSSGDLNWQFWDLGHFIPGSALPWAGGLLGLVWEKGHNPLPWNLLGQSNNRSVSLCSSITPATPFLSEFLATGDKEQSLYLNRSWINFTGNE